MELSESEFLQHYLQNSQHMMWFLGAGASRTAGLATASDIIWDLKCRYYCRCENQDLKSHDINNSAIKQKIQSYLDSQGFPALWSPEEYSFYFDLTFDDDYVAQQKYISEALASDKVSLNIGHRVLAALIELALTRIVFTTNFDDVLEIAYSNVSGKNLSTYHLEGSYAALVALNAERFPIYAKIHGDFRYQNIKNISADLRNNDQEIQKCFLAAGTRYGLIVSGYSGRDENVMTMLREAVNQNNAFPHGLFWTVPRFSDATEIVRDFITYALNKGVRAHIVESGTFDEMLSKIWRQVEAKPQALDAKVRTSSATKVSIPLPKQGNKFPILRTNALPVMALPARCGSIELVGSFTFSDLIEKKKELSPTAVLTYTDRILFWGDEKESAKLLPKEKIKTIQSFDFNNAAQCVADSSFLKSFFEEALVTAICTNRPLFIRRGKGHSYFAVVRPSQPDRLRVFRRYGLVGGKRCLLPPEATS
ncbi:MAG: SIR2 family protein [Desulfuromonadaceae bacterium]|nr:SIR2 family protein [Desulfuromonadaceae bacterium]MDD2848655.1 SIR2 family protein [Desulfuromonadaceae bacterium]MDD4130842.1 SIR2 family protein [Desulfuromonadaceae bacterium]